MPDSEFKRPPIEAIEDCCWDLLDALRRYRLQEKLDALSAARLAKLRKRTLELDLKDDINLDKSL